MPRNTDLTASGSNSTTGIRARRARLSTWVPRSRIPKHLVPILWGVVFVAGGIGVWLAVPRSPAPLPDVWKAEAGPPDASREMMSEVRASAGAPDLLKLEWPAHPDADEYRLRFHDPNGRVLPPVTVQSPVFLYDLRSDVLGLPDSFDWEVAAVLRDGSEVVAPARQHASK